MSNDMSLIAQEGETPEDVLARVTKAARLGLGLDVGPRIPFFYHLYDNYEGGEKLEYLSEETGIAEEILRLHRDSLHLPGEVVVECILNTETWTIEVYEAKAS